MYCKQLILASAALLTVACASSKDFPPPRYAVLRFENLTSDPSLDWVGRAASEVLIYEIGAIPSSAVYAANEHFAVRPIKAPGVSTELSDALLAGANRLITGYFESDQGALVFHLVEEEAATGKRSREVVARGALLPACALLARQITSTPKPYGTQNETALHNYIEGIESNGANLGFYQAAVTADPNFSDAYLALGELALASKDADSVARILTQAQAHKLDPLVIAKLQYSEATAFNDMAARIVALKRMIEIDPSNVIAAQILGEAEMTAHHFTEAASAFGKGGSESRPDLINLRAYALMFAGDEKGALETVHQYQKARPRDPNALDSEADIYYFFCDFAQAEKLYLSSAAKDPQFNQGLEVWKAARAHLRTGDVPGATQIFSRYRAEREKAIDASTPFRTAYWQFLTGDTAAGLAAMRQVADSATNAVFKSLALAQSAIWELQLDRKAEAARDAEAAMKPQKDVTLVSAALVRFAAIPPVSEVELQARAKQMFNGPAGEQFRDLAVAYTLFVAKRYSESLPIWKQLYERSNVNDAVPRSMYGVSLIEAGHPAEGGPLLRNSPPPATNLAPSFESFYFSRMIKPGYIAAPAR